MNTDKGKHAISWLQSVGLQPRPDAIGCGTATRHSGHVATSTGRLVDLKQPKAADICPAEFSHALAMVNRFTGHTPFPYSVAQHSVYVADECARRWPDQPLWHLCALLHDAAEAYCGDVARPLKHLIKSVYAPVEDALQDCIWKRLEIQPTDNALGAVHDCDQAVVMAEAAQLMPGSEFWNWGDLAPAPLEVVELEWREARWLFRQRFAVLYAAVKGHFWEGVLPWDLTY